MKNCAHFQATYGENDHSYLLTVVPFSSSSQQRNKSIQQFRYDLRVTCNKETKQACYKHTYRISSIKRPGALINFETKRRGAYLRGALI